MTATQRTSDELTADLAFAKRVARKFAGHPGIDYEQVAVDALMATLGKEDLPAEGFRKYLYRVARFKTLRAGRNAQRRNRREKSMGFEELDTLSSRGVDPNLLDGLKPEEQLLVREVFIEGVSERDAARARNTTRWQVRKMLSALGSFLEKQLGDA